MFWSMNHQRNQSLLARGPSHLQEKRVRLSLDKFEISENIEINGMEMKSNMAKHKISAPSENKAFT
jgi:hypothetical protein